MFRYICSRNSTACPHPGTNSGDDNLMRVQYAKSVGANVYVSIHLNSSNGAAHGVEVYYPNRNYNVNVSNQGSALANDIISQLTGLGLYNRGTQIKYSSDYKYDDGSTADYYSVIRNSKKSGFPAVIVEHAFITNGSDASNYLSSDAQLQKLGVADARGIVNYFGLSKGIDTAKVSVSGALNGAKDKYEVTARGLSGASQVKFAVWSAQNGQDDLRWYTGVRNGSDWRYSVPILNHKGLGTYNIHTYAVFDDGSQQNVAQNSFYVSDVLSSNIKIANMNTVSGYFDVQVSGVVSTYGVRGVQLAVWTNKNGQDDLRWYTATYKGNGIYSAHIDVSNHKCEWGIYNVHTYITNEKNTRKCVNMNKFNVTQTKASLSTTRNATWSQYSAAAWHVPGTLGSALKEVKFAVWSAENGQDDLRWYNASQSGDRYNASLSFSNHNDSVGTYNVHVYADYRNGTSSPVATTTFFVDGYKIMGRSSVNADKLVAYYNKHASYPAFYAGTDAPNLKAFCQMYIDECAAEDVKAEVAFAQAMKETNYLRYGGDVRINQFNFAGIGATGAVSGASFPNVRTGIRAQVQHLKAYASKETLKKSCVDPRFSYVTRGSAVYVEWLGIHENPKGNGWASDHNYGYSIRKEYINKI